MGQFLKLTQSGDQGVRSSGTRRCCTTCTKRRPTSTRRPAPARTTTTLDPIVGQRVVDAGAERRDGDDQARRARRVDLRVLRRLGAELHVLHRAQPQLDRPLLRGAELRPRSVRRCAPGATTTSREWFRPNPPLPSIKWGPRNNTNIQESALLFSLSHVAKNKELYLENYWLKNKRAVDKGKTGPTYAWVIPAAQRRKADAAEAVNELRAQGLEVSRATVGVQGRQRRRQGRRLHRPRRPAVPHAGRHVLLDPELSRRRTRRRTTTPAGRSSCCATSRSCRSTDKSILDQPMTLLTADAKAPGGIEGTGSVLVVEHTRQQPRHVPLQERGREDGGGRGRLRAGRPQVPRRRDHHRRTPTARSSSRCSRTSACRRGRWRRRRASRRTTSTCRASATSTAGRARRTKAGCARRSTRSACRTPTSPIRSCAKATCARSTT